MNDAYIHWKQTLWFHFIAFKSLQRTNTNGDYKFSRNSLSHSLLSCPLSIFQVCHKTQNSSSLITDSGIPSSAAFPANITESASVTCLQRVLLKHAQNGFFLSRLERNQFLQLTCQACELLKQRTTFWLMSVSFQMLIRWHVVLTHTKHMTCRD